ncbi:DUF6783 domain-containing protein [Blautia wexlerae]
MGIHARQIAGMIFQTRSRNCKYPSDL